MLVVVTVPRISRVFCFADNEEIANFLLQNGAGLSSYTLMDHPAFCKLLLRQRVEETSNADCQQVSVADAPLGREIEMELNHTRSLTGCLWWACVSCACTGCQCVLERATASLVGAGLVHGPLFTYHPPGSVIQLPDGSSLCGALGSPPPAYFRSV